MRLDAAGRLPGLSASALACARCSSPWRDMSVRDARIHADSAAGWWIRYHHFRHGQRRAGLHAPRPSVAVSYLVTTQPRSTHMPLQGSDRPFRCSSRITIRLLGCTYSMACQYIYTYTLQLAEKILKSDFLSLGRFGCFAQHGHMVSVYTRQETTLSTVYSNRQLGTVFLNSQVFQLVAAAAKIVNSRNRTPAQASLMVKLENSTRTNTMT